MLSTSLLWAAGFRLQGMGRAHRLSPNQSKEITEGLRNEALSPSHGGKPQQAAGSQEHREAAGIWGAEHAWGQQGTAHSSGIHSALLFFHADDPIRLLREVVLLTDDRNLRVKALTRNVPVRDIPTFLKWAQEG